MPDRRGHGLFVTGTDTGVGKTVACAALLVRIRRDTPVRYWKPIQTGIEQDDDTSTVRGLSGASAREIYNAGVRLPRPISPHLAARAHGTEIHLDDLVALASAQPTGEFWIIEGAGGALVPVNHNVLMVDVMVALGFPVVVVARSILGTINHTLLTIEALRSRALSIAGVILVGEASAENREAIEQYGVVNVIGELPHLKPLERESLELASGAWLVDRWIARAPTGPAAEIRER